MKQITIGDKSLKNITQEEVLQIAIIEGCCGVKTFWEPNNILDFDNKMFSDTIVLKFDEKRKMDGVISTPMNFFLNVKGYYWHGEFSGRKTQTSHINMETIKYLIHRGYDMPIY